VFPRYLLYLLVFFSVSFSAISSNGQDSPPPGDYVPGELLITPQQGVSDTELEAEYEGHGGKRVTKISGIETHRIKVPEPALDAIEAALKKNPKIKNVEKNFLAEGGRIPNDPGYASQWHLPKVSAPAGWDITIGSSTIRIAIIDSGVDPSHPDLIGKLVPGFNFLSDNLDTHDVKGHGTAVAGTAAAMTNSGIGVAGLAWSNSIMPLVVLNSNNYATYADIASAIIYAADHSAKVINISIGGSSYSSTLQNAVNYAWNKGLVIAASAMNNNTSTPYYPAALTNVLAVAATDKNDAKASFSNFGSWIDVAAPGTYIYTTNRGGSYGNWAGTSFSSPLVAALAALVFSKNPKLTNAQVVDLIKKNADDRGTAGFDPYFGWGRINAARTLQAAAVTPALSVAITSPTSGSTVSGIVPITAATSSPIGIAKVQFYVDGALKSTDLLSPYSYSWNSTGLSGSHTLVAKAYDVAGNIASSSPVTVSVVPPDTTPPTVKITGYAISGQYMTVTVSASDANGGKVVKVQLYVDGVLKATDTASPWSFQIYVGSWKKGSSHFLKAKAYDAAGNVGTSSQVTVVK
jgi:subtilisin family serine protease